MSHKCTSCGANCTALEGFGICWGCHDDAIWRVCWSDRELVTCAVHVAAVYRNYDNDHSYDQTGLEWTPLHGAVVYETRRGGVSEGGHRVTPAEVDLTEAEKADKLEAESTSCC